jgi:squalene cyclase
MELEKAIVKATAFLKLKQKQDGKWVDFELEVGLSTAWTTAFVATALSRRVEARDSLQKACLWLVENFRQGWGFNEIVPTDCHSTAWGILALIMSEVNLPAGVFEAGTESQRRLSGEVQEQQGEREDGSASTH